MNKTFSNTIKTIAGTRSRAKTSNRVSRLIISLILVCAILSQDSHIIKAAISEVQILESGTQLVISRVNFKNKENDWLEIYYFSPTAKDFNLKGLNFAADKIFKKIDRDFTIHSGQHLKLTFKADQPDTETNFYTTYTGLTATTEQITITLGTTILDAVCWSSKKPTTDEIKDQEDLFKIGAWISGDPASCPSSEDIQTNQSLIRKKSGTEASTTSSLKDTNNKDDWELEAIASKTDNPVPTSGKVKTSTSNPAQTPAPTQTQSSTTTPAPISIPTSTLAPPSAPAQAKTSAQPKPKATKTTKVTTPKKTTKATSKTVITNGDLSNEIIVTEIFPHALKDDRNNEWIEIYNAGTKNIDLNGWSLDDLEGGSKPFKIKNLSIKPKEFLIFTSKQTKLSLGNAKDEVRLLDYKNKLISSIAYEEAPIGKSYSRILVNKEDGSTEEKWFWGKPSPKEQNPTYQEIEGTIKDEPTNYFFNFEDKTGQQKNILFDESTIPLAMAKTTFIKGAKTKLNITTNPQDPTNYQLQNYEILADSTGNKNNSGSLTSTIVFILLLMTGLGLFLAKKHLKTEK
ncbi:MAG: lamin tail domain-containing protein [Candidatus Gracilibacteria bacterium]|jgi:hypothetical protein